MVTVIISVSKNCYYMHVIICLKMRYLKKNCKIFKRKGYPLTDPLASGSCGTCHQTSSRRIFKALPNGPKKKYAPLPLKFFLLAPM